MTGLPDRVAVAITAAAITCPGDWTVTGTAAGDWQVEVQCAEPMLNVTLRATDPMVLAKLVQGLTDTFRYTAGLCVCGDMRPGHNRERVRMPCARLGCDCPGFTPKYPPREGGG